LSTVKYLKNYEQSKSNERVNVVALLKKVRLESKSEGRKNLLITVAAFSVLAATGYIIIH